MNNKDFLHKAIILPAVTGIVFAVLLFSYINANMASLLPVAQNTVLAYHDSIGGDNGEVDADNLKQNDIIGTASFGTQKLNIRYEADYSNLMGSLSLTENSTTFEKIGCAYLKTTASSAKLIAEEGRIQVESIYGSYEYMLSDEMHADNEYQIVTHSPKAPRSLVIYCRYSNGAGFTSGYKMLIFKEV